MNFSSSVDNSLSGISLLQFLKKYLVNHSNKKIKSTLEMGCVTVNGVIERFSSKKVFRNDSICFQIKDIEYPTNISVLFEDDHFFAVNKPINFESTQYNISKLFPNCHLVHRLDKKTTGVLLVAKTKVFKKHLEDLFRNRAIKKKYLALVDGVLKKTSGSIESYLKRKNTYQGQTVWASSNDNKGLYAKTNFKQLNSYADFSIVELSPTTGRTHQLRVHLKELGHAILGDFQYCRKFESSKDVASLCLHAYILSFEHPITHEFITIKAPLPRVFSSLDNLND